MHMKNAEHDRRGSNATGAWVKEFFNRLRGLWAPKYIPQKSRFGESEIKETIRKSDLEG